jgi:hypothetical protein
MQDELRPIARQDSATCQQSSFILTVLAKRVLQ